MDSQEDWIAEAEELAKVIAADGGKVSLNNMYW